MTPPEPNADATPEPAPTRGDKPPELPAPEGDDAARPQRPTQPGRPVHMSSGLVPVAEVSPSRPATRPLGQPPSLPPPIPIPTTRAPRAPTAHRVHALTGPLSAPPGSSPLTAPPPLRPTRPDVDLSHERPSPSSVAPTALDLPLAPLRRPQALEAARGNGPRLFVLAAFALGLFLPTAHDAPWRLLDSPSGPTALSLAGILLLPGLDAGPPHLVRWALRLVAAVTLTALATLALADTIDRPPWGDALDPLHGALTALGFTMLVGGTLARSSHLAARIAAVTGAVLLLAAALVPGPTGIPVAPVFAALSAPATTADLVAAIATLAFAAAALTTTILRLMSTPLARPFAFATWLLAIAPLGLHTAFSTPPGDWMQALGPLKAIVTFAGALLLCADAIAPALEPEPRPDAPLDRGGVLTREARSC